MTWQGEKLKDMIQNNNLPFKEMAKKLGVSQQTISEWINGKLPSGSHLVKICRLLNVEPNMLFINDDDLVSKPILHF